MKEIDIATNEKIHCNVQDDWNLETESAMIEAKIEDDADLVPFQSPVANVDEGQPHQIQCLNQAVGIGI